jgi:hypothetical protein
MRLATFVLISLLASFALGAHAEGIARIGNLTGVVHVQSAEGRVGLVYEGAEFKAGDTLSTEADSTALLVFSDGSQAALRPNTRFVVNAYRFDAAAPQSDSMIVSLLKGGVRTLSGLIGKRGDQKAYRMSGVTATIGIRGTDFTTRLCEADCADEQARTKAAAVSSSRQAGRAAVVEGELTAIGGKGGKRTLDVGSPFFEGDQLRLGEQGHAMIVMTDGTRVLMEKGSRFQVAEYRFVPLEPERGNMLFEFLRGRFRVVSGLLAKKRPEQVRFSSVTATIGIRGTAFDVVCTAGGASVQGVAAPATHDCDGGIYLHMRDGSTEIKSGPTALLVEKGQSAHVEQPGGRPTLLPGTPGFIGNDPLPLPENLPVDVDKLFGGGPRALPAGLYVEVNDGMVALAQDGQELLFAKGESGYAPKEGGTPLRLSNSPAFLDADPVLGGLIFSPAVCQP